MKLQPGYSMLHIAVYLISCSITIALFVFLNSTQGFVLRQNVKIPIEEIGDYSGSLVFYDELMLLSTVLIFGILSDYTGRAKIWSFGFLLKSISLFFFTKVTSYAPNLLLLRLLFAVGASASSSMIPATLADLVLEQDRGKLAGLVGLFSGMGAVAAVSVLLPLPILVGLDRTYMIASLISLIMSFTLLAFSFSNTSNHYLNAQAADRELSEEIAHPEDHDGEERENIETSNLIPQSSERPLSLLVILSSCKSPPILVGLLSSFLARSDSLSITLYLPLWVYKFYLDNHLCIPVFGDEVNSCNEAYLRASILAGVTQSVALIAAPIFGIYLDRFDRINVLFIASFTAAIGYICLSFSPSPLSGFNYLFLLLIGIGEIGLVISSITLVTVESIPKEVRGSVAGMSSFFGGLGILIFSKAGGVLFDLFSGAPFLVLGMLHFLFLTTVSLYWRFANVN